MYQKVTGRDGQRRFMGYFSCSLLLSRLYIYHRHYYQPSSRHWMTVPGPRMLLVHGEWRALRNYSKGAVHWRVSEWVGELMDSHRIIIVILIESIGGNYHRPSWTEVRIDFRGRSTTSEVLRGEHEDRCKRFISRDSFCLVIVTEDFKNKIYFGNPIWI